MEQITSHLNDHSGIVFQQNEFEVINIWNNCTKVVGMEDINNKLNQWISQVMVPTILLEEYLYKWK